MRTIRMRSQRLGSVSSVVAYTQTKIRRRGGKHRPGGAPVSSEDCAPQLETPQKRVPALVSGILTKGTLSPAFSNWNILWSTRTPASQEICIAHHSCENFQHSGTGSSLRKGVVCHQAESASSGVPWPHRVRWIRNSRSWIVIGHVSTLNKARCEPSWAGYSTNWCLAWAWAPDQSSQLTFHVNFGLIKSEEIRRSLI